MIGRVVSTKLKNTVTVLVERIARHPLYKKTYVQSKKYSVHDLIGVKMGDIVDIQNCKPISRNKHWIVKKVLGRSLAEIAEEKLKKEAEVTISEVMPEKKEIEESSVVSVQTEKEPNEKQKKIRKRKDKSDS